MTFIINIINEYLEAGQWSLISIQHIHFIHKLHLTNTIITLWLSVLHVGFVIIIEIHVTAKNPSKCLSFKTADTTNSTDTTSSGKIFHSLTNLFTKTVF